MNTLHFTGRLAKAPALTGNGERAVCKFTLIRNDYAGKDQATGEKKEKVVSIQFTAFRAKAEAIARHAMKGDQLIVSARLENNTWTDGEGQERYGYNFVLEDFEFGAPGEEKRQHLSGGEGARLARNGAKPGPSDGRDDWVRDYDQAQASEGGHVRRPSR